MLDSSEAIVGVKQSRAFLSKEITAQETIAKDLVKGIYNSPA